MNAEISEHADKYNDPRVKVTTRGILIGITIFLLGVAGAALSIWARRTVSVQTTSFWGEEVIEALQLAEEVELLPASDQQPVRLSGMPGLGHLRHVLLDDRSYDWQSIRQKNISNRTETERSMTLRLTDPSAERFSEKRIVIGLESGFVGLAGGAKEVQLNERFREAMPNYLSRIANYESRRAESRQEQRTREQVIREQESGD